LDFSADKRPLMLYTIVDLGLMLSYEVYERKETVRPKGWLLSKKRSIKNIG